MNVNHIRALLKCSVPITGTCSRILLKTSLETFKESKKCPLAFARIYCSYINSVPNEEKQSMDSESDEYINVPNYRDIDHNKLTRNDESKIKKLKLIQEDIHYLVREGEKVPTTLKLRHWQELMRGKTKLQRYRYLKNQRLYEDRMKNQKLLKKERYQNFLLKKNSIPDVPTVLTANSPIQYGLGHNTIFFMLNSQQVHRVYNWKLLQASMCGPDILVDCSYENFMDDREMRLCSKQLAWMWSNNRLRLNPFNVIYCNINHGGSLVQNLGKLLPVSESGFPIERTEKNYTDLFDKEKLVYLTPHGTELVEKYDGDSVYIIGAFVDTRDRIPISLAKAKEHGLRTAKLPLDKYLNWKKGKKLLMLHQCLNIMTELKDGKDLEFALRHVLSQNISDEELVPEQKEKRDYRYATQEIRDQFLSNRLSKLLQNTKED